MHLLLRVPSFARWPLKLHFFAPEVHAAWLKWCSTVNEPLRDTLRVVTDFGGSRSKTKKAAATETEAEEDGDEKEEPWGIHALPVDYEPMKEYVSKGQEVFEFEREGNCVVCHQGIEAGEGLHALCVNEGCEGVGHLSCWSKHILQDRGARGDEVILPIQGRCPKCQGEVLWGDMMKELTLRTRGQKEVEKLLKTKRKRAPKAKAAAQDS